MILGTIPTTKLTDLLGGPGLLVEIGPFTVRIRSSFGSVRRYLASHYADFQTAEAGGAHFSEKVDAPSLVRRWLRPQALVTVNGTAPFHPTPRALAPGLFEWGLNWAIGNQVHHLVVVHAAVVARGNRAIILPAPPDAGKSTLAAALAFGGWRLFSDEFALIDPDTGDLLPLPRPIALKGGSIPLMAGRVPGLRLGPELVDAEGAVARHAAPLASAVAESAHRAKAAWIIVPRWRAGAPVALSPVSRARTLGHLADSSFNYNLVGPSGFQRLADVVDHADCYSLSYGDLDEALHVLDRLDAA